MIIPDEPVFQKPLANGLSMRTVANPAALERVCALSAAVHGEGTVGEMTRKLFSAHPDTTGRDLVYIQNAAGEAVSTLCLIPWTLRLSNPGLPGITLKTAELGIVGTLERYQRQGLNRLLMEYFWQRYHERGCLLSIIEGIPNYYRQFGYEYAMLPLIGGLRLQPDQIPAAPAPAFAIRPATRADIPALLRLYDEQAGLQQISACRSVAIWDYLLTRTEKPEEGQHDTLILEDIAGQVAGYFRIPDFHFHPNLLTIDEVSDLNFNAALATLDYLKQRAAAQRKEGIRLQLPKECSLMRLAHSLGALDLGVYSWQVSIPDRAAFLLALGPLLEQRLAGSMFAGLSGRFSLNFYKETLSLSFAGGRLEHVDREQPAGNTILSIPPVQFVPLALGQRSLDEIHSAFPDASSHAPWGLLVDTLFPKCPGYLATIY